MVYLLLAVTLSLLVPCLARSYHMWCCSPLCYSLVPLVIMSRLHWLSFVHWETACMLDSRAFYHAILLVFVVLSSASAASGLWKSSLCLLLFNNLPRSSHYSLFNHDTVSDISPMRPVLSRRKEEKQTVTLTHSPLHLVGHLCADPL